MATPYAYECPKHGRFVAQYPMGEAPRMSLCPHHADDAWLCPRDYSAGTIQFTYGKEDWHGPTLNERLAQQKIDAPTAEPVGTRWV